MVKLDGALSKKVQDLHRAVNANSNDNLNVMDTIRDIYGDGGLDDDKLDGLWACVASLVQSAEAIKTLSEEVGCEYRFRLRGG